MSEIRETTQVPLKLLKLLYVQEKSRDLFSSISKNFLLVSLVTSIGFFLLFFSTLWVNCPTCSSQLMTLKLTTTSLAPPLVTQTNLSHIFFGIGGTAKTWNEDRRHYSELWWRPNITRGFVWLDQEPTEWPQTSPPYQVSEDTSRFMFTNWYGSRSAIRIARIVLESYRLGMDDVRWMVLGDDDTVFFVENLVTVLSKYDHNEMHYIGSNSESVEQDVIHSYGMAYGGGGIALSYALVVHLVKLLDGCIDRYAHFYGSDERIGACVAEIGVSITLHRGFHQVDIRGDPYGLIAAHPLAPLVSLHHLGSVNPLFPDLNQVESLRSLIGAYKTDPARTLQQSFCYDPDLKWSFSVSWGYTIQIYPSLLTAKELATPLQTFSTWRTWSSGPFAFNTRLVSPDTCQRPVIFYLDGVHETSDAETLTSYKRFVGRNGEECRLPLYGPLLELHTINVTSLKMQWHKVQQRDCCEIVNSAKGALQIRIRTCGAVESVTPP